MRIEEKELENLINASHEINPSDMVSKLKILLGLTGELINNISNAEIQDLQALKVELEQTPKTELNKLNRDLIEKNIERALTIIQS